MMEIYEKVIKPILPKKFDENEWFTIFITLLVIACVYYITMKSRALLWSQIICVYLLNLQLTTLGDYFLAMPPYDFYDTIDLNSGELFDIFLQNIVYPGTILCFIHFYKKNSSNKVVFILLSALTLFVLEVIAVYIFHLYTYNNWKLYYSFFFYLLVMIINLLYYEKLTKFIEKRLNVLNHDPHL
ncbi:hypothetical protein [Bacillus pinisoli]|uniref:hypothetical protein n=1 Tax=Bacillus pinisoli TaxID=2901866 RepID=UPI001FF6103D|nr:hypothetical protein [Bacillus pinisoli]